MPCLGSGFTEGVRVRVPQPLLVAAMARQLRSGVSELPDAPAAVRNELLSIASTLRFLASELEHGEACHRASLDAARELDGRLRSIGMADGVDLAGEPAVDVPALLARIAQGTVPPADAERVFAWLVDYQHACNQAELEMFRRGNAKKGGAR